MTHDTAHDTATVVIQAAGEERRRALVAAVGAAGDVEVLLPAATLQADAVLLAVGPTPGDDVAVAAWMLRENRARQVLLVGPAPSPELLLAAMRAGVAEYLAEPFAPAELSAALMRARARNLERGGRHEAPDQAQGGRVVLVLGAKGGVGATTIAVNLADGLCRLGPGSGSGSKSGGVALLDLAQPQGEIPIFLDLEHAYTWADVAANMARLDATYLESVMARHASGLSVLASPGFGVETTLDPQALRQILALLRGMYAYVVIDLGTGAGSGEGEAALEALEQADEVLLVLDLSLPCLARAKRFLEAVRAARPRLAAKLRLVANRKTSESDIGTGEAENILQADVSWSVLNDYKTALHAINQGRTLAETDPKSALARGVAALARDIARSGARSGARDGMGQHAPAEADSGRAGSLWSRLMHRSGKPLASQSSASQPLRAVPAAQARRQG